MAKANTRPWDEYVLLLGHRWAGHVARMQIYDQDRVVYRASVYKDYRYLRHLEQAIGSQGHHYNFHVWRWEKQFADFYGATWRELAVQQEAWKDSEIDWLTFRKNTFNGQGKPKRHKPNSEASWIYLSFQHYASLNADLSSF
eukprot:6616626-Pyramimonas_sp.AAC.2